MQNVDITLIPTFPKHEVKWMTDLAMAKVGEPAKETEHEVEQMHENEEKGQNGECSYSQVPDTCFLSDMNLLIMFFSLFSVSAEDNLTLSGSQMQSLEDHEAKACMPRLHTRRQETHETKLVGRTHKLRTSIKDFRSVTWIHLYGI